ncbi:MAG: ABC transporter permease [Thaumarchaeota archaeon]|nr:ABC transporter permease [Candidatus Geocrenenecus arthurdayi]MCL7391508.1 ABC transporter permease [Candidatus Geocrenenecus arthurdayi]MCL7397299.1 ABC transporter permease [Candidatus Geocrenenecus arthurdayi]MCL7404165.1 ABC transporter permease [Candidatus Geocrenenecus arthurdayi]
MKVNTRPERSKMIKQLFYRSLSLLLVAPAILLLMALTLGLTGISDRILVSMAEQTLQEVKKSLATQIHDPSALEAAIELRKEEIYSSYGLDKPWFYRMFQMIIRIATFDLGRTRVIKSFTGSQEVSEIILERIPNTILLVTIPLIFSAIAGISMGVKIASRPGTLLDRLTSYLSIISYTLPSWWIGIILIILFGFYLKIFPVSGMYSIPPPSDTFSRILDLIWHSILPFTTLVIVQIGGWIYSARMIVLNIAQEDYVNAARAKGLPEDIVRRRYILRVAAPPIVTNIVLGLSGSLGGAIITETIFGWYGMGSLYYQAIMTLEENLLIALTYIYTLIYISARIILEIMYLALDPRVRY